MQASLRKILQPGAGEADDADADDAEVEDEGQTDKAWDVEPTAEESYDARQEQKRAYSDEYDNEEEDEEARRQLKAEQEKERGVEDEDEEGNIRWSEEEGKGQPVDEEELSTFRALATMTPEQLLQGCFFEGRKVYREGPRGRSVVVATVEDDGSIVDLTGSMVGRVQLDEAAPTPEEPQCEDGSDELFAVQYADHFKSPPKKNDRDSSRQSKRESGPDALNEADSLRQFLREKLGEQTLRKLCDEFGDKATLNPQAVRSQLSQALGKQKQYAGLFLQLVTQT